MRKCVCFVSAEEKERAYGWQVHGAEETRVWQPAGAILGAPLKSGATLKLAPPPHLPVGLTCLFSVLLIHS